MADQSAEMSCRDDGQDNRQSQGPDNLSGQGLAEKCGQGGEEDYSQVAADGNPGGNLEKGGHQGDEQKGTSLADKSACQADSTGNKHRLASAESKLRHVRRFAVLFRRDENQQSGKQGHDSEDNQ